MFNDFGSDDAWAGPRFDDDFDCPVREREDALSNEAMTQGEYARAAVNEYARNHGADRPDSAWILSPFDTWEANPFFVGPRPPHPESCEEELDAWFEAHPVTPPRKSDDDLWAEVCEASGSPRSPFF